MQKQTKNNLYLLLLVITLLLTYFALKKKYAIDADLRLPLSTDVIESIEITHSNVLKLKKQNDTWLLVSPLQGEIRKEKIEKILTYLQLPVKAGFDANPDQFSLYGLDKARLTVKLNDETLSFGQLNTNEQMHYVLFKNKVYLVHPFLQISFDVSAADLLVENETETLSNMN